MLRVIRCALLASTALASPLAAQGHTELFRGEGPGSEGGRCATCHVSHADRGTEYGLRLGNPGDAEVLQLETGGVSAASLSCWRCHGTAQTRRSQPDVLRAGMNITDGAYLGTDFSDDHRLGRASAADLGELVVFDPRRLRRIEGEAMWRPPAVECTSCHDPHDRDSTIPTAGRQLLVCGACHEVTTYANGAEHPVQACSDCHALHGGTEVGLIDERSGRSACRTCHAVVDPPLPITSRLLNRVGGIPSDQEAHASDTDCQQCHRVHGPRP